MDLLHDATLLADQFSPRGGSSVKKPSSLIDMASASQNTDELVSFMERSGLIPERESVVQPTDTSDRSKNLLRPVAWDDVVGQQAVKNILQRMARAAKDSGQPMDHVLFVGPSGTGKTTLAHVLAHDLGVRVFQLEAPVSHDMLVELCEAMHDGDILFVDEIHQQAIAERRGRSSSTQPEVLFGVMEDFTLTTQHGVLPFPHITVIGGTTDEGALPDAFINRFPVRPRMEKYNVDEMAEIVQRSAAKLGRVIGPEAAMQFARASRGVPREVNNYLRNAASLTAGRISRELASEVLHDLNGVTADGLTSDMQKMLVFLVTRARHESKSDGDIYYQASVSTVATAIGKSRDQKAIALRVEPYLIEKGYVQVGHGGRRLTDAGIERARQLQQEGVTV